MIDPWVEPTCAAPGKTEGSHCSVCNEVLVKQDEIPALDHEYITVIKKATPKKNGSVTEKCKHCGKINEKASYTIYRPKKIKLSKSVVVNTGFPKFTVIDSKNKKISENNYISSFKNNVRVGVETLTVTFFGKYYRGKMKQTFTVKPQKTTVGDLMPIECPKSDRIKVMPGIIKGIVTGDVTGYQIQYSTKKNFKKAKSVSVKISGNSGGKEIKGLKADTKYYIRIRTYKNVKINGKTKKIYSDWSKRKFITTPKMPTLSARPVESKWLGGYELYVLHLDENGYPYYYCLGSEENAQAIACRDEMTRYMEELKLALGSRYTVRWTRHEWVGENITRHYLSETNGFYSGE